MIVITGSSRGLGFALAEAFLNLGCSVMLSGRTRLSTEKALAHMGRPTGTGQLAGFPCDVRQASQLQDLWEAARSSFEHVDIWINNAGLSNQQASLWQVPAVELATVVETNLLGVLYGSQVATRGMIAQGFGAVYNMYGMGSDGRMHEGLIPYGTTKYALSYFTKGLAKELQGSPVIAGALRPGMLVTDMIVSQYKGRPADWEKAKRIFNIIADRPEKVAPWLAYKVLENQRNGAIISYTSNWKLAWRFLSASFRRRDLFTDKSS